VASRVYVSRSDSNIKRDPVNVACYEQHMAATYGVIVDMHKNLMGYIRANNGFI
jgi:hypothetical protein